MLKRSKSAGLIIDAHFGVVNQFGGHEDNEPGVELALKHGARIRDLSLLYVSCKLWDYFFKQLPKSAPRLERLVIEGIPYAERPLLLPEHDLRGTERLRHLELGDCNINWNSHSHFLHSLTHLKLRYTTPRFRPTGNQFWDILKGMPDLEFLHLIHAIPVQTDGQAPWASGHIHFASLHTLQLNSNSAELESFFSCVTFPPAATVIVNVSFVENSTNTNSSRVISSLGRSYSSCSSDATFQAAILEQSYIYCTRANLKLYMNALSNEHMLTDSYTANPSLDVRYNGEPRLEFSAEQAIANLAIEPFNNTILHYVKQLYLPQPSWPHEFDAEPSINVIGRLPWLQSIMVGDTSTIISLLNTLILHSHTEGTGCPGIEPAKTLYFPRLSSICLLGITFDDPRLTIEMLHDCLAYRQNCGAEIKRLSLWRCWGLEEKYIKLLAQVVGDVDVQISI